MCGDVGKRVILIAMLMKRVRVRVPLSASYAVAEDVDAINEVEIVPKESPYEQKVRIMLAGF